MNSTPNPVAQLRRLRTMPRLLLAVLVLAVAQMSLAPCSMAQPTMQMDIADMPEHCQYCPTGDDAVNIDCSFPHEPTVDVFASSSHHVDVLLDSPLLQPATFDWAALQAVRSFVPIVRAVPLLARPYSLTYCVQLK